MTIGPAPMIRIDLMSVRLGIGLRVIATQKKGALSRVLSTPAVAERPRARGVLRPELRGMGRVQPGLAVDGLWGVESAVRLG